ncbi:MAG: hypothetical protein ACRENN_00830 [Candidatus Eiseniibacteriota bacterium]
MIRSTTKPATTKPATTKPAAAFPTIARAAAACTLLALLVPSPARAQIEATPREKPPVTSYLRRTSEERDRLELGAAMPEDYFDVLGTFGYRRFIRERAPFEQSIQIEAAAGKKDYLTEGSLSLYYLFRPLKSYRESWKLRPLLEAGPGAHVVVQSADLVGFSETAFHVHGYLKAHLYGGAEYLLTRRVGFLVRGRISVPAHHPADYAQAAIFLR